MSLCRKETFQSICHHLEGGYKNMRKIVSNVFIIMMLLICSIGLTSCKAITAQNITNTGSGSGMNGGGVNGGTGMKGNTRGNGNSMREMTNADLIGKVVSVDGNSIKVELVKQTKNNKSSNSNAAKQGVNGNQSLNGVPNANGSQNNNKRSQGGFQGGKFELSYTGEVKTLTVNSDVKISERTNMPDKNGKDNSKSSVKVSDLKKDQVIMIWYKQNTKTVERINIMKS